ncbi:MAG: hypothetical protein E4H13_08625 [Calditrichales bacterium]|nr:MAG: hypothetical protein E4H13_08625 [Calditrichales bacterium]
MRKRLLLLFSLLIISQGFAQNPGTTGSYGLFHTHEARVLMPGQWDFWLNTNFYTKLGEYLGQAPADFSAANYWVVAGNTSITYGIIDNLDATVALRLYQDTHHTNIANVPGDVFLTIKGGNFNYQYGRFNTGVLATFRFPTGEVHNYPLAEYASGAVEYGFLATFSYYKNPYLPSQGLGIHFNIGWWNHNENGKELELTNGTTRIAGFSSSELQIMLGTAIPLGLFKFGLELSGGAYTKIPEPFVYSAEDYAFLTPSLSYSPYNWISMDLGIDLRVSPGDRQRTTDVPDFSDRLDLPKNYPPWKAQLGMTFSILPAGAKKQYGGAVDNPEIKRRLNFYEKVAEEKEKAKEIEKEIDRLRKIRETADDEIEDIRKELEED